MTCWSGCSAYCWPHLESNDDAELTVVRFAERRGAWERQ